MYYLILLGTGPDLQLPAWRKIWDRVGEINEGYSLNECVHVCMCVDGRERERNGQTERDRAHVSIQQLCKF